MLSKYKIIVDPDHVILIKLIVIIQELQNLELHTSLILELFLVSNDFNSDHMPCFMIKAFDSLSEGARPKMLKQLISIP